MNIEQIRSGLKESDMWGTPRALAAEMVRRYGIWLDVCATAETSVCEYYIAPPGYVEPPGENRLNPVLARLLYHDALSDHPWDVAESIKRVIGVPVDARAVWMNPPYSNPTPWVRRAAEEGRHITVVGLLKADTSTNWWREYVATCADEVWFLPRLKHMGAPSVANFPQAIVIWRPQIGVYMGHRVRYPDLTPEERGLNVKNQMELEAS